MLLDAALYLRRKGGVTSRGEGSGLEKSETMDCVREMNRTRVHRVSVGLRVMVSEDGKERPNGRVPILISF